MLGVRMADNALTRSQGLANIELGLGQDLASAQLAGAQADAADRGVLGNILGTGLGAYAAFS